MSANQSLNRYLLPIAAFAITMSIGLWFMGLSQNNRVSESRLERLHLLADVRSEVERQLAVTLTSTEILANEVVRAKGRPPNFYEVAQGILDQFASIDNMQIAPNGIVRRIHPLAGNVEALGHNILGDKKRNTEALASVESGQTTLAGPLKLAQGGVAVIVRKPVYLRASDLQPVNMNTIEVRPPFWGFVSALIKLDDLLESPTLTSLSDKGYSYHFSRIKPLNNTYVEFVKNGTVNDDWSDKIDIWVPNDKWTLSISNNNAVGTSQAAAELAMTLLLALLFAFITWFSLQRRGADTPQPVLKHRSLTSERQ